jgi:hypothetical protein
MFRPQERLHSLQIVATWRSLAAGEISRANKLFRALLPCLPPRVLCEAGIVPLSGLTRGGAGADLQWANARLVELALSLRGVGQKGGGYCTLLELLR